MIRKIKNLFHAVNAFCAVCFYGYPAKNLQVIAVTGTDGKTTTSSIIYHLLNTAGFKVSLITTVGGFIGSKEIDTGLHTTTPNPWILQRLIREVVQSGSTFLVLEATSHGLDQHRLMGTNRSIGVMTNVSHEHLDYHGTMEKYLDAKAKLFTGVKYAVLNATDDSFEPLKQKINQMVIRYDDRSIPEYVQARFPEKHNQLNAQAAISVARIFDIEESDIQKGIETFGGVKGRSEEVINNTGIRVIVDFAHTPNALSKTLTSLKQSTKGKLIAVFGATGRRDTSKRPMMGDVVSKLADFFIITTDDSYDEKIEVIINQIKGGITKNHGNMISCASRKKAIDYAVSIAKKGDTIVLLGKGHEKAININGDMPWSDQEEILKSLSRRKDR